MDDLIHTAVVEPVDEDEGLSVEEVPHGVPPSVPKPAHVTRLALFWSKAAQLVRGLLTTGLPVVAQESWVPGEVLGNAGYAPEPKWGKLQQMPFAEFYQGLRERNWTNAAYDANAPPWSVQLFQDSGRFLRPSFDGFRHVLCLRTAGLPVNHTKL